MSLTSPQFDGNLLLAADAVADVNISSSAGIQRSKMALDILTLQVGLTDFRVWDAFATLLPGTPADDDLGLVGGTYGTGTPSLRTTNLDATAGTLYARVLLQLPAEYSSATSVTIRLRSVLTRVVGSGGSATADVEAYKSDGVGVVSGSDLVTTTATDIDSASAANYDFALTTSGLVAGDVLDVRLTIAVTDGTGTGPLVGTIGVVNLLAGIRG